jgi:hypothetical protein
MYWRSFSMAFCSIPAMILLRMFLLQRGRNVSGSLHRSTVLFANSHGTIKGVSQDANIVAVKVDDVNCSEEPAERQLSDLYQRGGSQTSTIDDDPDRIIIEQEQESDCESWTDQPMPLVKQLSERIHKGSLSTFYDDGELDAPEPKSPVQRQLSENYYKGSLSTFYDD